MYCKHLVTKYTYYPLQAVVLIFTGFNFCITIIKHLSKKSVGFLNHGNNKLKLKHAAGRIITN